MRGSKKAGPVKRRVMRGGGMAKKAGPVKKRAMRSGGRSAADSEKAKDAHSRSSHKYFAGASQNPKRWQVAELLPRKKYRRRPKGSSTIPSPTRRNGC